MAFVHQKDQRSIFFCSFKLCIKREITPWVELREAEAFREGEGKLHYQGHSIRLQDEANASKRDAAAGWLVKFVVGGKIFKQKRLAAKEKAATGASKGKQTSGTPEQMLWLRGELGAGSSFRLGKHGDKAGCLIAPPTPYFHAQDHQTTSPVAYLVIWLLIWLVAYVVIWLAGKLASILPLKKIQYNSKT